MGKNKVKFNQKHGRCSYFIQKPNLTKEELRDASQKESRKESKEESCEEEGCTKEKESCEEEGCQKSKKKIITKLSPEIW